MCRDYRDKPKTRYARFRLDWPALRAGPARAYWPALRAGQARATHGPITQLSANRPSDFYNIDYLSATIMVNKDEYINITFVLRSPNERCYGKLILGHKSHTD